METIEVRLDARLHSEVAAQKAAHRYSDNYFVKVVSESPDLVICLTPKDPKVDTSGVEGRLRNDALDEQLRLLVRDETHELHAVLTEAALRPMTFNTAKGR